MTDAETEKAKLIDTVWIMKTSDGWYPVQITDRCKPEIHGEMNDHVMSIEDMDGKVLWQRTRQ